MSEVKPETMNGGQASVDKKSITEQLTARGFEALGKSGLYIKKVEKPEGTLKVNVSKKVAMFQTQEDAYETYGDVPELAEVQALLKGEPVKAATMGQDMKERMGAPAKDMAPSSPAKNTLPAVPARDMTPAINKEFMQSIQGTPQELVITLGGKRYATKNGRWYAFHSAGLKVKKQSTEVIRYGHSKGEDGQYLAICKSIIIVDNGKPEGGYFEALGEACPDTVSDMIFGDHIVKDRNGNVVKDKDNNPRIKHVNHLDHMAETRAENRCLGKITAGGWYMGNPDLKIVQDIGKTEGCTAEETGEYEGSEGGE